MTEVKEGVQHREARRIVEFYIQTTDRRIMNPFKFDYPPEFIKKHSLGTRSRPNTSHTYDIMTPANLIEIDDLDKHSKKSQRINDGIATDYARTYQKHMKLYRLLKEEIADRRGWIQPDAYSYLREHLF